MSDHAPCPIVINERPRGRYVDVVFGARRWPLAADNWRHWPTLGRLLNTLGYRFGIVGPPEKAIQLGGCTLYGWQLGADGDRTLIDDCRLFIGDEGPESAMAFFSPGIRRIVIADREEHQEQWAWWEDERRDANTLVVRGDAARLPAVFGAAWEFLRCGRDAVAAATV